MNAIDQAERASLPAKRVSKIVDTLTHMTCRYINMGLYEKDKLLFVLLVALKVLGSGGYIDPMEMTLFLRGSSASVDTMVVKRRPVWINEEAWKNACALSERPFFRQLLEHIGAHEATWKAWFECSDPSNAEVGALQHKQQNLLLWCGKAGCSLGCVCTCVRECVCVCACVNSVRVSAVLK